MTSLPRLTQAEELLDQPHADTARLQQSLGHVAQVNRWLGGDRCVLEQLERLGAGASLELLDVGTGSAALPRRIVRWARRKHIPVRIHATDLHPQILELARLACRDYPEIIVEPANALRLPYADASFSHALLTLTLHHFTEQDQMTALRELTRVSRIAAIVSELERGRPNYLGARLLAATWWRRNPITRHDGPLSVLRSFTRAELEQVGRRAGIPVSVQRKFFCRLVLVADKRLPAGVRA